MQVLLPSLLSLYKSIFSPFLSTFRSCEYLHLNPFAHWPLRKNSQTMDLGSTPTDLQWYYPWKIDVYKHLWLEYDRQWTKRNQFNEHTNRHLGLANGNFEKLIQLLFPLEFFLFLLLHKKTHPFRKSIWNQ